MSDVQKLSLTVLHAVSEFLTLLPAEHLNDLAEGTARLAIIPKDASEPLQLASPAKPARRASSRATAEPTVDMSEARGMLDRLETRDAAKTFLEAFNHKPHLTALAALLGMRGYSSLRKGELVDTLIELTVGNRLNSGAIRQL